METFDFGKYKNKPTLEIKDISYLVWYYNKGYKKDSSIRLRLLNEGVPFFNGKFYLNPKELENDKLIDEILPDFVSVEVQFYSNVGNNGTIEVWPIKIKKPENIKYGVRIPVRFNKLDLTPRFNNGYNYWTPKGKPTFRGKTASIELEAKMITSIEFTGTFVLNRK